jgi:hypothetical protein
VESHGESTDSDDKVMVEQSSQFEIKKLNEYIYNGSLISTQNFNLLVTLFTSHFNLSFKCVDELLKFIEFILPQPNNLITNYSSIIKTLELDNKYIQEYLCSNCWSTKNNQNLLCNNNKCTLYECDNSLQTECTIELFIFDINEQLNEIIKNEEQTIISYLNVKLLI